MKTANLVAVNDLNQVIDAYSLDISENNVRSYFKENKASYLLLKDKIFTSYLPKFYKFHTSVVKPYNKSDASKKEVIMNAVFKKCDELYKANDLDTLSTFKIDEIVKPLEDKMKFTLLLDRIDLFNYMSDCVMVQDWIDFVVRNNDNELYILISE